MPKPDHPPAFPFYPNDFASDSRVEAMSTEAVGAYILLLCKAWREEPPGTLPDDDSTLARWARLTPDRWTELRSTVLAPFTLGTDSRWHQKRMRRVFSELIARRKVRTTAGKAGADARWQTHSKRNGKRMKLPMANDGLSSSSSSSSSLPSAEDGAKSFSQADIAEIRAKGNRFRHLINLADPDDRNLVAKIAILWHSQALSDDDVEQVIESFSKQKRIDKPGAWLHKCMANKCKEHGENLNQLLASTTIPQELA